MKGKLGIIVVVGMILIILIVIILQAQAKKAEVLAQSQNQAMEGQAILAALNIKAQSDQIEAQETASVGDWLSTIGNIAGAVTSVLGGGSAAGATTT